MENSKKNQTIKTKEKTELISSDFFPEGLEINRKEVYPMMVMATMSSGKSTLINALLGQQILPSQNEACTSKMFTILDEDRDISPQLYISKFSGETRIVRANISEALKKANEDTEIEHIFIKGQVKGVLNTDKALLIIDTPGPNNARDISHEQVMKKVLGELRGGLILYVLNATQIGIEDDKKLLNVLKVHLEKRKSTEVLFVINKMDQVDEERESVENVVMDVRNYLLENGFENPQIIPVSALAANIFKKALNNEQMTRLEHRMFDRFYELYGPKDFSMKSYAMLDDYYNQFEFLEINNEKYKAGNIIRAIENTGIKLLEEKIQKQQIRSSGILKNTIKINRGRKQ